MSPIIDFVRRQLSSTKLHEEQQTTNAATTADLVSRSGYLNEGKCTAMDHAKRQKLGLNGLLPAGVETLETQKARALRVLRSKHNLLEKYILMAQLRTTNVRLFYKIVIDELEELAPVIYTPTVGTACLEYSTIYPFLAAPGVSDGLYLTKAELPELCQTIRNYRPTDTEGFDPEIAVISDGSRILGLGDLGTNGIGIPIGKLQLYVAGAGIDPRRTLPIILDLGTNNEKLLNDEFYIGLRQKRPNDEEFYQTVDTVLTALHTVYPNLLIQFEDWSSEHAFGLLDKYQNEMLCFNDDIQGTGAVILSGVINAIRKVEKENQVSPRDHRIVFYGAGSAAIGVARQIQSYFQIEHNMTEEEAKRVFWIVDSKGLVTTTRGDKLAQHKVYYARDDNEGQQYKKLIDIVDYVKPTAASLIGLSSTTGAFNTHVLERLASLNEQPIVFPLSNPATQAECTFEQAMEATNNKVIFASGTAFPAYTIKSTGETKYPGQGNNMYIFPGLGLGAVLAKPKHISDRMIYEASKALADSLTEEEVSKGWLYPSLKRIRSVSAIVAAAVCQETLNENLATSQAMMLQCKSHEDILDYVKAHMWSPNYGSNHQQAGKL
ncbi:NADP-dependent malic enzyme MaeA [Mucor ambiguus]|uniref:Malic enzyme n=1 Tax=Mucor ambiguus TaxID=91626 RepID=A0A0C9N712_9FUNG|nr:NADP-dependent malic enzyme MaeA [Mucor ambiguus]